MKTGKRLLVLFLSLILLVAPGCRPAASPGEHSPGPTAGADEPVAKPDLPPPPTRFMVEPPGLLAGGSGHTVAVGPGGAVWVAGRNHRG